MKSLKLLLSLMLSSISVNVLFSQVLLDKTFLSGTDFKIQSIVQNGESGFRFGGIKDKKITYIDIDHNGKKRGVYKEKVKLNFTPSGFSFSSSMNYFLIGKDENTHIIANGKIGQKELQLISLPDSIQANFYAIKALKDGNYLLTGNKNNDSYITEVDNKGRIIWNYTLSTQGEDDALSISESTDSSLYIVGHTSLMSTTISSMWIIKMDRKGNLIWDKILGTEKVQSVAYDVVVNQKGNPVITGNYGNKMAVYEIDDKTQNIVWKYEEALGNKKLSSALIIRNQEKNYINITKTKLKNGTFSIVSHKIQPKKTIEDIPKKDLILSLQVNPFYRKNAADNYHNLEVELQKEKGIYKIKNPISDVKELWLSVEQENGFLSAFSIGNEEQITSLSIIKTDDKLQKIRLLEPENTRKILCVLTKEPLENVNDIIDYWNSKKSNIENIDYLMMTCDPNHTKAIFDTSVIKSSTYNNFLPVVIEFKDLPIEKKDMEIKEQMIVERGESTIKPNLYIISVGTNNEDTRYAENDAKDIVDLFLTHKEKYNEISVQQITGKEATATKIKLEIRKLEFNLNQKKSTEKDIVIFFFSGQSFLDSGQITLKGSDFTSIATDLTAISIDDINENFSRMKAQKILLLDACLVNNTRQNIRPSKFEGAYPTMYACQNNESSFEHTQWKNGAFTEALLEALKGKADLNNDGVVLTNELFQYVNYSVKELVDMQFQETQTPVFLNTKSQLKFAYKIK